MHIQRGLRLTTFNASHACHNEHAHYIYICMNNKQNYSLVLHREVLLVYSKSFSLRICTMEGNELKGKYEMEVKNIRVEPARFHR